MGNMESKKEARAKTEAYGTTTFSNYIGKHGRRVRNEQPWESAIKGNTREKVQASRFVHIRVFEQEENKLNPICTQSDC